jgi:hypothetical protein
MIGTPSVVKKASNGPANFVPVADQERQLGGSVAKIHVQVTGLAA